SRGMIPRMREKTDGDLSAKYSLLLGMVRLINDDPILMLHNPPGRCGREVQQSTLELMNAFSSVVCPDLMQESMQALLTLHQPHIIELWNPAEPMVCFWDISSHVLYTVSQKLIQRQIANYGDVLRWLKDILICRNAFLEKHKELANVGSNENLCRQALIKLEMVFFMYLWSLDIEAVLTAMSCFGRGAHACVRRRCSAPGGLLRATLAGSTAAVSNPPPAGCAPAPPRPIDRDFIPWCNQYCPRCRQLRNPPVNLNSRRRLQAKGTRWSRRRRRRRRCSSVVLEFGQSRQSGHAQPPAHPAVGGGHRQSSAASGTAGCRQTAVGQEIASAALGSCTAVRHPPATALP
uniref:Ras-GEF domain-containing protein n=1 Tax=Macrostomum lignano TaxID=282301 RepID=A0A1I8FQ81_9PLAT